MSYLLLLACSKRKRAIGCAPALDLYDGGAYRVLRKLRRERGLPAGLHILILSARYGLLRAEEKIEQYDQLMDPTRAEELRASASARLDTLLAEITPTRMHVDLGKTYQLAIASSAQYAGLLRAGGVDVAEGPPGVRLGKLKTWLLSLTQTCHGGLVDPSEKGQGSVSV